MSQFDDLFKTHINKTISSVIESAPMQYGEESILPTILINWKSTDSQFPHTSRLKQLTDKLYITDDNLFFDRTTGKLIEKSTGKLSHSRISPASMMKLNIIFKNKIHESWGGYQAQRSWADPYEGMTDEQKIQKFTEMLTDPATQTFINSKPHIKFTVDHLPTLSSFMLNILGTVLRNKRSSPKQDEIFAREYNQKNKIGTGDFFGNIGDRHIFDVEFVGEKEGMYRDGIQWKKSTMKMNDGKIIIYKSFGNMNRRSNRYTGSTPNNIKLKPEYTEYTDQTAPIPGDHITFAATIKDHIIDDGKKVTVISRPSRADMTSGSQSVHGAEEESIT